MESRAFIKYAGALIKKIKDADLGNKDPESIQKEINQLFQGLGNPTLLAAADLRDTALAAGFYVDQRVLNKLEQAEEAWE